MPQILIEALPGTIQKTSRVSLKECLLYMCPRLFSVADRELTEGSFSPMFPVFGDDSDPTHDIVIRIRLNDDVFRLDHADDHAEQLYEGVRDSLRHSVLDHRNELRVGICLDYGTKLVWYDENGLA